MPTIRDEITVARARRAEDARLNPTDGTNPYAVAEARDEEDRHRKEEDERVKLADELASAQVRIGQQSDALRRARLRRRYPIARWLAESLATHDGIAVRKAYDDSPVSTAGRLLSYAAIGDERRLSVSPICSRQKTIKNYAQHPFVFLGRPGWDSMIFARGSGASVQC